jgi:hypothetical protein
MKLVAWVTGRCRLRYFQAAGESLSLARAVAQEPATGGSLSLALAVALAAAAAAAVAAAAAAAAAVAAVAVMLRGATLWRMVVILTPVGRG